MKLPRLLVPPLLYGAACLGAPQTQETATAAPGRLEDQPGAGEPLERSSASTAGNSGTAIRFNGQTWSVADELLFAARFERFLSTPEETGEQEIAHRKILSDIIALLAPAKLNPQSLSEAYRLLTRAAGFPGDSRLCDTLSGAIYGVWQSRRSQVQLAEANKILEEERTRALQNMAASAATEQNATGAKSYALQAFRAALRNENSATIKSNNAKSELSELQAKIQYQGLLVQLFLQRRFHHVLIGTRFYQALFSDGDSKLNLPDSVQNPFSKTAGAANASVSSLEALASGALREVQAGMLAFSNHFEQGRIKAASESLRESLLIGEFMPEMRTLPFVRKKSVLHFVQTSSELREAIRSKDYATASKLVAADGPLARAAADFDPAPALALIEAARNAASLHLAQARSAANAGDRDGFEAALKEAAAIWPANPELLETAKTVFLSAEGLSAARTELDRLLAQKNYRLIAAQSARFLAATHGLPEDRQREVKAALESLTVLEANLKIAAEMDSAGNSAGAWETVQRFSKSFPEDPELIQAQVRYTTKAAEFIRSIQNADSHEAASQHATSLAWLLKAQRLYPPSSIAAESINRNLAKLFP